MATIDEPTLRDKVRRAVQVGTLPNRRPDRTWGGPSANGNCAICGASLKRDRVEFEIEFGRPGDLSAPDRYHVHLRCFAAWEAECQALEPGQTAGRGEDRGLP